MAKPKQKKLIPETDANFERAVEILLRTPPKPHRDKKAEMIDSKPSGEKRRAKSGRRSISEKGV